MRNAIVSIEDRRFYQHGAIDPSAWAVRRSSTSGRARSPKRLDDHQQLVKNRCIPQAGQRSLKRKIIEAALAYQVEQHWSKQKILEEYLNTIYFGHSAYGVEAAAEDYFGVHAKNLQPQQAALLAALVQNPTGDDPVTHPARARARHLVLGKLLEQKYIDRLRLPARRLQALLPEGRAIGFPPEKKTIANYFVDYVASSYQPLRRIEGARRRPARVYTLNPRMQRWRSSRAHDAAETPARAALVAIIRHRRGQGD